MKNKIKFHNETTIKNALLLFGQGWSAHKIALKMKVTDQTVYNWKTKYPSYAVKKVTSRTSKNGTVTTIVPTITKSTTTHEVTISLNTKMHKNLATLATYEVRTISDQVKSLVHRELERIERNSKNIPF